MESDKIVVYQDLEDIYVLCMRQVISSVCEKAWGDNKKKDDGFAMFKKHDLENTKVTNKQIDDSFEEAKAKYEKELKEYQENTNKKKPKEPNPENFKHIAAITSKAKSFKKFDFQACNNTIAHLENVYNKIFSHYKLNDSQIEICKITALELVRLRNKLAHRDPEDPPSQIVEYQKGCINGIRTMLNLGFGSATDKNGIPFSDLFKAKYNRYVDQELQQWYPLSDFLDLELYDASRFLDACATNKITATKKDAKYFFRTSNLEKTVEILKNNLAINGDDITPRVQESAPTPKPPQPDTQPQTNTKKKSNAWIYIIISLAIALILGGAIMLASLFPALASVIGLFVDKPKEDSTPSSVTSSQQTDLSGQNPSASAPGNDEITSSDQNTTNQIPAEYEQQITALQHSSELSLSNKTLTVKVGEYITPPPATVWDDIKIYSQDTNIAIGEGVLVKGVAPGTTYIIVESRFGSTSAFCVVVE